MDYYNDHSDYFEDKDKTINVKIKQKSYDSINVTLNKNPYESIYVSLDSDNQFKLLALLYLNHQDLSECTPESFYEKYLDTLSRIKQRDSDIRKHPIDYQRKRGLFKRKK